jgi:hypothetical protein
MGVFDMVMEKPGENRLTASTDISRFFHDYFKHTHRLD